MKVRVWHQKKTLQQRTTWTLSREEAARALEWLREHRPDSPLVYKFDPDTIPEWRDELRVTATGAIRDRIDAMMKELFPQPEKLVRASRAYAGPPPGRLWRTLTAVVWEDLRQHLDVEVDEPTPLGSRGWVVRFELDGNDTLQLVEAVKTRYVSIQSDPSYEGRRRAVMIRSYRLAVESLARQAAS